MGNYMSAKGFVVTAILFSGFIGFIVGVPSYQMVYTPGSAATPVTYSYFGACDSINQYLQNCHGLTLDFLHCQNGDSPGGSYTYDPFFTGTNSPWFSTVTGINQNSCRSMIAAEAFGIMAIIFSFLSVVGAIVHEKGRLGGGASAVLASICGIIALAVFFSMKPLNGSKDVSDLVGNGVYSLGYSSGLQVVGIIASFIGGVLAFLGDFGPSGGVSTTRATHHPQSSTAGTTGTEMH